jgi:transcription-repair coupling factor (superfamily II helicase)
MKLGFEKLTLKNRKMLCYFLTKKNSDYFSTPIFQGALLFAQKYPNLCTLKEQNNKLFLTVEDVSSVKRATAVLNQIEDLIPFPEVPANES